MNRGPGDGVIGYSVTRIPLICRNNAECGSFVSIDSHHLFRCLSPMFGLTPEKPQLEKMGMLFCSVVKIRFSWPIFQQQEACYFSCINSTYRVIFMGPLLVFIALCVV